GQIKVANSEADSGTDGRFRCSFIKSKRQKQSGKKPSGQQSQKGNSRYPKITAEVQARFRQKSKVASQARVNTQARFRQKSKIQKTGREIGTQVGRENTGSSTKGSWLDSRDRTAQGLQHIGKTE